MKLCRFNSDRLGLLDGEDIIDVSKALDALSQLSLPESFWTRSFADPLINHLDSLRPIIEAFHGTGPRLSRNSVSLDAPVSLPSKIIGAPVNYHAHFEEALNDKDLHQGRTVHPIDEIGCFLKASSSLVGDIAQIRLPHGQDRVDYEGEIAVIVGKTINNAKADQAMDYVAGYALALDMSVRGKQDRSMRKSCDGFSVLGPALVTKDEVPDPAAIPFELSVNGEQRQSADTSLLIRSIPELIEMCSAFYTLHPGDVIMTGTPAGVGPVYSGDKIELSSAQLGKLSVSIQ